jgi:hypothetical protein
MALLAREQAVGRPRLAAEPEDGGAVDNAERRSEVGVLWWNA